MGRGILSGLIWGSLISFVVFGTVSQLAPLAPPGTEEATATPDDQGAGTAPPPAAAVDAEDAGAGTGATEAADSADPAQAPATSQLMEKPETDSLPEPASGLGQTVGVSDGPATGVDVPAGSEFRKALPETVATLPSVGPAPDAATAPAVPAPGAVDDGAGLALDAAPRPEAPGMSVAAPSVPDAAEQVDDALAATPGTDAGADLVAEPARPEAAGEESAPDARLAQGFPPPIRPDRVEAAEAAVPGDAPDRVAARDADAGEAAAVETPVVEDAASGDGMPVEVAALAPSDPARLADTGEARPADRAEGARSSPAASAERVETAGQPGMAIPAAPGETAGSVSAEAPGAVEVAPSERPPEVSSVAPRAPMAGADLVPATASPATTEAEQAEPVEDMEVAAVAPEETTPDTPPETAAEASPLVRPGAGVSQRVGSLTERRGAGSRLPQISTAPGEDDDSDTAAAGADAATAPASTERPAMGALTRNARPFDNPDGKPLFSVILIEDGQSGLDPSVLSTFSFPVSFAIDPTQPGADEIAAELSAAGFEIVALATGLPEGARPSDVETTFGAHLARLPRAVAVMDLPEGGIAGQRALVEQAVTMAAQDGHGLIGWRRGLNPLETAVRRGGTPVALIYRSLDDEDERSTTIKRYLDRAAFKAVQDGSVVMVGRNRPETVTALFEWALGSKASQVALAPISAILRQQ